MKKLFIAALVSLTAGLAFASVSEKQVTIYSAYEAERLAPIFKPFSDRTGINVNIIFASSAELLKRMTAEGADTAADLYLDKDLVWMGKAQENDLLQAFSSKTIEQKVPAHLISQDKNWMMVFYRARILVYNANKVQASELSTYEALGADKWKGRLCLRTSNNSYNEALGAYLVKNYGEQKTLSIFNSWVQNLAVDPIKGDTDVIKAVAAGTCDVGIANSYYLAPLIRGDAGYPVKAFFPEQNGVGTHINGVVIGITKASKKQKEATLLMEYFISKEVQTIVADGFSQYPVNPDAEVNQTLVSFGPFKEDLTNPRQITPFVKTAQDLMKQAGYK